MKAVLAAALACIMQVLAAVHAHGDFYSGAFNSHVWQVDETLAVIPEANVKFMVALKLRNTEDLRTTFHEVSNPNSVAYGSFLSLYEISQQYGPTVDEKQKVIDYLMETVEGAEVKVGPYGDILEVVAPIGSIHHAFDTKLGWVGHVRQASDKVSLRAIQPLKIPAHIQDLLSFVSLNVPVNHVQARGAKSLKKRAERKLGERSRTLTSSSSSLKRAALAETLGINPGNEEALVQFVPTCGGGAQIENTISPPCSNLPTEDIPEFLFEVTTHNNNASDAYLLDTDPITFAVPNSNVYCYSADTAETCTGVGSTNCICIVKLSPLPKYTQLRVNATMTFPASNDTASADTAYALGISDLFALTDVATAALLSDLYAIPPGISVQHGSNQSCAEFYGEFYSNSDLEQFFALSGLPNATIPDANVLGDLPNDQSNPGGEAQLDVEYIMALAPGAETYFYSMGDYNPNDPVNTTINEGFLAYLTLVNSEEFPPLVHSLSYGDVEAEIFNVSNNGSVQYGERCNQEFMKMGLRGLSVLFSSGDDGVGSSIVRDDPDTACATTYPEWPASSPYVTAVGATQLTDKYLPVCGQPYSVSSLYPDLPVDQQLRFECTGTKETVCSSTIGGVITSGGGFSSVSNRSSEAPWQQDAVDYYLRSANSAAYPPPSYFNTEGRGYPDVATYGSNYFVYLNGKITRESGTSASAPVFAAMVTLWNDIRLAYDMPPMGFIAPFLYQVYASSPDAFHDIVTGDNACGAGHSIETVNCCEYSFSAVPGWDAVTGLGSPNFDVISNLVLNNASYFPNLGAYPDAGASIDATTDTASSSSGSNSKHDDDDDDDEFSSETNFSLAAAALVIALISLAVGAVGVFLAFKAGSSGSGGMSSQAY